MRTKLAFAAGIAGLLAVAAPAWAHHAFAAEFDAKKPIHLEGTVTQVELINPHSWIHVEVANADGTKQEWMCEAGSPNILLRRGFNKNTFPVGSKVIVDGYQSKDGSFRMNGRDITTPSGQKFFLGSTGTGAPYDATKDGKQDGKQ
jgi:Family of unknown function (DUF6152)